MHSYECTLYRPGVKDKFRMLMHLSRAAPKTDQVRLVSPPLQVSLDLSSCNSLSQPPVTQLPLLPPADFFVMDPNSETIYPVHAAEPEHGLLSNL